MALAAAGILCIEVQADRVQYLRPRSDVYQAVDFIDRNLAGTTELDVWVEGGQEGIMKEPATLRQLEELVRFLRAQPEIDKVICINDFLKEMHKAFHSDSLAQYVLPPTREMVAQFLLIYGMSGNRNELDKYVDYPYSRARISVRTSEQNSAKLDLLIAKINAYLAEHFRGPFTASLASAAVANNNVFHYMVRGLLMGLGAAMAVVGIVLALTFRSLWSGLVCMVPNLVPIVACLGLMGWGNIWLEIATAMTFSIALGIAVDDTIHFVSAYRLELARTGEPERAVRSTLEHLGPALVRTSVVIMGGFLVLVFASLKMNMLFGLLSAFIIFMALLTDLVITPVCMLTLKPFKRLPLPQQKHDMLPARLLGGPLAGLKRHAAE
jgi:predicted RND superfamily exporter protein